MGHSSGSCGLRTVKVNSHAGLRPYQPIPLQLYTVQVGCTTTQILCPVDHVILISEGIVIIMNKDILWRK